MIELTPQVAFEKINLGFRLIDIREKSEYAREHILKAENEPLSTLKTIFPEDVIFTCQSGMRTSNNAETLSQLTNGQTYILSGGLNAWKKAGLATVINKKAPLDLMRQMQMTAGSLILLGLALAYFIAAPFLLITAFIGAGLLFSGLTGWCGMIQFLRKMPWNHS